jgi:hypothetical protein
MAEYDKQAASRHNKYWADKQQCLETLGGGREGVMRAQYQNQSDMNRAALQAQLLQQGFGHSTINCS